MKLRNINQNWKFIRENMEQALEFCREDECIEVTPKMVRVRKVHLSQTDRARAVSLKKKANAQEADS